MPLQIPVNFAQAAFEMRFDGDPDPWFCTLGVDVSGQGANFDSVANELFAAWAEFILPYQSTQLHLHGVTLRVGTEEGPLMAYSTTAAATGASAGQKLPQNCALLVDKMTASGGHRNRGRMFVPGLLGDSEVDNVGLIGSAQVTTFQTQFSNFLAAVRVGLIAPEDELVPVILHNTGISPTPLPTPITSLRVQSIISTQRKRLR